MKLTLLSFDIVSPDHHGVEFIQSQVFVIQTHCAHTTCCFVCMLSYHEMLCVCYNINKMFCVKLLKCMLSQISFLTFCCKRGV